MTASTVSWRARALLAAGLLALRAPSLSEPRWYSDDGFFTAVAFAMSRGVPLYAGIFDNSPPGIYWLYRGLLLLGGDHRLTQAYATVSVIAASLLTVEIARRVGQVPPLLAGALTGFALSVPTLDGDLLNVELVALPFFLGGLALSFAVGQRWHAAAGALLALAVLVRPSFAFDGVAVLVPLALRGREAPARAALTALGASIVVGVALVALWWEGSLAAYRQVVLPADHAYLLWSNGGTLVPVLARLLVIGAVGAVAALRATSTAGRLAAAWLAGSVAGATLTPREFSHYTHEAIPALAFAASLLVARFPRLPRAITAPAAGLAVLVAAQLVLVLPALTTAGPNSTPWRPNITYAQLPAYFANWLGYMTGRRSWSAYAAWFPSYGRQQEEAQLVRSLAGGDQARLIVLGDAPWLYPQTGLLPATPFLATNSAYSQVPTGPATIRDALQSGCAAIVVARDGVGAWAADLNAAGYVPVTAGPWPTFRRSGASSCRG